MRQSLAALAVALAFLAGSSSDSAFAAGFSCPPAGTIVATSLGQTIHHGAKPGDPMICQRKNIYLKEDTLIFNFYPAIMPGADSLKAALAPFFTGEAASLSAKYTSATGLQFEDIWTRPQLPPASVGVGQKTISAEIVELERFNRTNAGSFNFHGKWKIWRDPATGIWLKSEFTSLYPGTANPANFLLEVISIADH